MSNKNKEDPFASIEKGNSLESSRNKWGSSEYYSKASSSLLSEYHSRNNSCDDNEKRKIAALYHDQSVEYLNKARQCLIGALMFEREEDLKRWGDSEPMVERISNGVDAQSFEPFMNLLTDEEMNKRIDTFQRLFVSPFVKNNVTENDAAQVESNKDVQDLDTKRSKTMTSDEANEFVITDQHDKLESRLNSLEPIRNNLDDDSKANNQNVSANENLTLEQRLAMLDSTLPAGAKNISDDERYEKIKNGLDDLGIHVPSHNKQSTLDEEMTDDEQMELIMNMAKDEVALNKKLNGDDSNEETVEEIMKRSGIRFEVPDEHLKNELLDSNDAEVAFWSSLVIEGPSDEKGRPGITQHFHDDDDNDDFNDFRDVDDFKRGIAKSQQMLLQANLCLDEVDLTVIEMNKSPGPNTCHLEADDRNESLEMTKSQIHENECIKDEKDDADVKQMEIFAHDEAAENSTSESIKKIRHESDDVDKDLNMAGNEIENEEGIEDVTIKRDEKNGLSFIDSEEGHVVPIDQDDTECEGDKQPIQDDKTHQNEVKHGDVTPEPDETNEHEKSGDVNIDIVKKGMLENAAKDLHVDEQDNIPDEEMKRITNMGKHSIMRAHAILEKIIKAWPKDN